MTQDSEKCLDEICEALDNLAIKNLELIEEKVTLTIQLEKLLRQGRFDLAKARYIRGKESVGMTQVPSNENEIKSLFVLETSYKNSEKDENKVIPHFDISLRQTEEGEDKPQNPMKWFGVLVPRSLKSAQWNFQNALYVAVKLANVQAELMETTKSSSSLNSLKVLKTEAA